MTINIKNKHLLGIQHLSADEITRFLDTAESFKEILARPIKKVPTLRGCTIVNLFFEPSTRTKLSFELAAKRLSADTVSVSASTSSVLKGETLIDTVKNIEAMKPSAIVIRHSLSGVPWLLARHVECSIINAGDGINEHPTQALLDAFTIKEHFGRLAGLKIAIIGDILHSRVAHSGARLFSMMGADVFVCGPLSLMPPKPEVLGVKVAKRLEEAVDGADVVMSLRLQKERQESALISSEREYARFFGISSDVMVHAKKNVLVMHPGPINRGVEMTPDAADGEQSAILEQVTNGVAVRMATLSLLLAGSEG